MRRIITLAEPRIPTSTRGASELISEFWKNKDKDKGGKAAKPKGVSATKPRKSATRDPESAAPSAAKKRKKAKDESDDEDGAGLSKVSKKRGTTKRESTASGMDVDKDDDNGEETVGQMEKYMNQMNWENLVDKVDTVERGQDDGELYVYFTLYVLFQIDCVRELCYLPSDTSRRTDKERHRQTNAICRKRFPQKVNMRFSCILCRHSDLTDAYEFIPVDQFL